jgi:hypothetical protein
MHPCLNACNRMASYVVYALHRYREARLGPVGWINNEARVGLLEFCHLQRVHQRMLDG